MNDRVRQIVHQRLVSWEDGLLHNGGATIVVVEGDPGKYHLGVSVCSTKDPFAKKVGVAIATNRALKAAEEGVKMKAPKVLRPTYEMVVADAIRQIEMGYLVDSPESGGRRMFSGRKYRNSRGNRSVVAGRW